MDRLSEASVNGVTHYVDDLFANKPTIVDAIAELSLMGVLDLSKLSRSELRQQAIDALCSREWFRQQQQQHELLWWAPQLPLDPRYCAILLKGTPNCRLLAHYTNSLRQQKWNYREHCDYPRYVAAVLACPKAPTKIREDFRLLGHYTPKPLPWDAGRAYLGKIILNDRSLREPTWTAEVVSLDERRLHRDGV